MLTTLERQLDRIVLRPARKCELGACCSVGGTASGEGPIEQVRSFWDLDAATYDNSASHNPRTALELAAWAGELRRLLPPPPARVLDVGTGTGFLALLLAKQGYQMSALDLSPAMLARLQEKAAGAGLEVKTFQGDAAEPPLDGFDAVVERHLLWTLPDPAAALAAWDRCAPQGRLVLLESLWGGTAGPGQRLRRHGHESLRRLRKEAPDHHGWYDESVRAQLPLSDGATPEQLVFLVESTAWGAARVVRLRDVEWAARRSMPSVLDRALGVTPRFAVAAR